MSKQKRSSLQNRIIHQLLGQWGFTDDDKAELVYDITKGRTASSSKMSFDEANVMIERLEGKAVTPAPVSRRTQNHRKQKAGVKTIASATSKDFMHDLARGRNISAEGLEKLSARVNGGNVTPRTAKEVSRIIEAIKKMNERDKKNQTAQSADKKEAA